MRSEKELFKLAQLYVGLEEQFNRASSEFELDEIKYELAKRKQNPSRSKTVT